MMIPIWRWSRSACWAAATDFGRITATGITTPGNSTKLRTGTMMVASGGSAGRSFVRLSATRCLRFLERHGEAPVYDRDIDRFIAPRRQPDPPLEPSLRQLEAMDHRGPKLARQDPASRHHEIGAFDRCLDLLGGDPRQRHENEHLPLGLQHVNRWLPGWLPQPRPRRTEKVLMHAFGSGEHLASLRPHPIPGIIRHSAPVEPFDPVRWSIQGGRRGPLFNRIALRKRSATRST